MNIIEYGQQYHKESGRPNARLFPGHCTPVGHDMVRITLAV